jgi:hypothetical protein
MNTVINIDNEVGRVKALTTWHPIAGTWVHIGQKFEEDGSIVYYVNGQSVEKPDYNPPESIIKGGSSEDKIGV